MTDLAMWLPSALCGVILALLGWLLWEVRAVRKSTDAIQGVMETLHSLRQRSEELSRQLLELQTRLASTSEEIKRGLNHSASSLIAQAGERISECQAAILAALRDASVQPPPTIEVHPRHTEPQEEPVRVEQAPELHLAEQIRALDVPTGAEEYRRNIAENLERIERIVASDTTPDAERNAAEPARQLYANGLDLLAMCTDYSEATAERSASHIANTWKQWLCHTIPNWLRESHLGIDIVWPQEGDTVLPAWLTIGWVSRPGKPRETVCKVHQVGIRTKAGGWIQFPKVTAYEGTKVEYRRRSAEVPSSTETPATASTETPAPATPEEPPSTGPEPPAEPEADDAGPPTSGDLPWRIQER